jgi:hypothetical protein
MQSVIDMVEGVEFYKDEFKCKCGNTTHQEGFHPCLRNGTIIEPDLGSYWDSHYKCDRCSQVYYYDHKAAE